MVMPTEIYSLILTFTNVHYLSFYILVNIMQKDIL